MKTYSFKVKGMSCGHCEHALETSVKKVSGVSEVKASASKGTAQVKGSESVSIPAVIDAIKEAGFEGEKSDDEEDGHSSWSKSQFIFFAIAAASLIFLVSYFGGFNFFPAVSSSASLSIIFVTGLLTSLHCTAMCGGINLSQCLSKESVCAKKFSGIIPSSLYNGGRVISYTATGALTGALGSVFDFSPAVKSGIMIAAGIFMLLMGLSFTGILNVFPRIGIFSSSGDRINKRFRSMPAVVGLLSGLMPCGPLQAMQMFALGSGSAAYGALAMFIFALGTFPLMFAVGALSSFISRKFTAAMFKVGGVVIIILSITMISNGLTLSGVQLFASEEKAETVSVSGSGAAKAVVENGVQKVRSTITSGSYQPIAVQAGIPVEWIIVAKEEELNGCNGAIIIPEYNIRKRLEPGENKISFVPSKSGIVPFSCWMGMIPGSIKVVDNISSVSAADVIPAAPPSGQFRGSCCGRKLPQ